MPTRANTVKPKFSYLSGTLTGVLTAPALISWTQQSFGIVLAPTLQQMIDHYRAISHAIVDVILLAPLYLLGTGHELVPNWIKDWYFLLYSLSFIFFSMYLRAAARSYPAYLRSNKIKRVYILSLGTLFAAAGSLLFLGLATPLYVANRKRLDDDLARSIEDIDAGVSELVKLDDSIRDSLVQMGVAGQVYEQYSKLRIDQPIRSVAPMLKERRQKEREVLRNFFLSILVLIVATCAFFLINAHLS